MTRPNIIRADTIDLQHDQQTPSAQKHIRHHVDKALAPHQAAAVKHVTEERIAENEQLTQTWTDNQQDASDGNDAHFSRDEQAVQQNGGMSAEDGEMVDAESDEDLDEELMDKISSSPSIDDGGYTLPSVWPKRSSSLTPLSTPTCPSYQSPSPSNSSSPFTLSPSHYPLFYDFCQDDSLSISEGSSTARTSVSVFLSQEAAAGSKGHHLEGEYLKEANRIEGRWRKYDEGEGSTRDSPSSTLSSPTKYSTSRNRHSPDRLDNILHDLLLPENDSLLEESFTSRKDLEILPSPSSDSSGFSGSSQRESGSIPSWDESEERDDDSEDISFSDDPRFVDYGFGAEYLREVEDIDFEFVYALHTFVATVDGQANATKGDTMVLLDDSNSYWWLVRIVKDSSIGYLPAEHIETPTERLARLNKHRNIDLSQPMLGDNAEKSKNPLKKAMRRRITKTVQFTAPTYVEASDYDYTSEEESDEQTNFDEGDSEINDEEVRDTSVSEQETIATDNSTIATSTREPMVEKTRDVEEVSKEEAEQGDPDGSRSSEDNEESTQDTLLSKSRKGTVRNTDSFFKDETRETQKITLTPKILREDNSGTPRSSDSSRGPSLDGLDKALATEKSKDDRKKKEKKSGMLSGLFKRKDKKEKGRSNDDDVSDHEKVSGEISRGTSPKDSNDISPTERRPSDPDVAQRDRRVSSRGKLQKVKNDGLVNKGRQTLADDSAEPSSRSASKASTNDVTVGPTLRAVDDESSNSTKTHQSNLTYPREDAILSDQTRTVKHQKPANDISVSSNNANISKDLDYSRSAQKVQEELPAHSSAAQERLSDSPVRISPSEVIGGHQTSASNAEKQIQETKESPSTDSSSSQSFVEVQNTEGPKQVSPSEHIGTNNPLKMAASTIKQSEFSGVESTHQKQASITSQSSKTSITSSSTPSNSPSPRLPDWSDASLLTYLNDDSDISDLLLLIHDKSQTIPLTPNHPAATEIFGTERNTVSEMGRELDKMLASWMMKKAQHNKDHQQTVKITG